MTARPVSTSLLIGKPLDCQALMVIGEVATLARGASHLERPLVRLAQCLRCHRRPLVDNRRCLACYGRRLLLLLGGSRLECLRLITITSCDIGVLLGGTRTPRHRG